MEARNDTDWRVVEADGYFMLFFELRVELAESKEKGD